VGELLHQLRIDLPGILLGLHKKPMGTPNSSASRCKSVKEGTLLPFSKRER
jgi:hypothetical protein